MPGRHCPWRRLSGGRPAGQKRLSDEMGGIRMSLETVDHACPEIEQDKYVDVTPIAPCQLQAAATDLTQRRRGTSTGKREVAKLDRRHETLCSRAGPELLTRGVVNGMHNESDTCCLLRSCMASKGDAVGGTGSHSRFARDRQVE